MAPTATGHRPHHPVSRAQHSSSVSKNPNPPNPRRHTGAAKPSRSPPLTPSVMPPAASRPSSSVVAATPTGSQPIHPGGVSSKKRGAGTIILPLDKSLVEVPHPDSEQLLVKLQPEVVSSDGDQALVKLRSPDMAIRNKYFTCSGQGGDPVFLPPHPAVVFKPEFMALLGCGNRSYLVAHLEVTHNQKPGGFITEGSLHWCKYNAASSSSSSPKPEQWIHQSVTLLLPNKLTKWDNHRVIPFNGTHLMWVDPKQGILVMSLSDGKPAPNFRYVGLPSDLPDSKGWRNDCPDMYRSVVCCNGKVQLVNLHVPDGSNTADDVAVNTWTLDWGNGIWSKDNKEDVRLKCKGLWESYHSKPGQNRTTPWPNTCPISPFLMEDNKRNILGLTVVDEKNNKKAWLLQIDMQNKTLEDVTMYPHYYSHMKQPFLISSSLSSVTSKNTMILWPF